MTRLVIRALTAAVGGAIAAVVALTIAFNAHPDLTFEMDRDLPRAASGFYPIERVVRDTFAWTTARAEFVFPRFDRAAAWRCSVSVRGGRPAGVPLPMVGLEVDGVELVKRSVTNEYQSLEVGVPARPHTPGLRLGIAVAPTFVPAGDPRPLGVQVDRLSCRPVETGLILPPRRAIVAAALAAAVLGAAFSLAGVSTTLLAALVLLVAAAQSFPISTGPAPYLDYTGRVISLSVWIGLLAIAAVKGLEWRRGQPIHELARFAIAFSAVALYLKLVGLLHPSKPIVDALFHAHRLEWVLAGRYFFTQQMPDGVQFPYAIALYVFSWPWTLLTRDYVTLLRIVVCAMEATAGALLYLIVARSWGDRAMGALAVVFFHFVPLPYLVLGNANLTNAFGASVSLLTMAAATVWPLGPGQLEPFSRPHGAKPARITRHSAEFQPVARQRNVRTALAQFIGLSAAATVGLLSHISIFGLLLATLLATAVFYWFLGGQPLRRAARLVFFAAAIAAVVSVAGYYAHFGDAYRSLDRTGDGAIARATTPAAANPNATPPTPATPVAARPWYRRMLTALDQGVFDLGWPIVILALVGARRLRADRLRDRLTCAICAWGVAYAAFLTVSVMAPVDVGYERYAAEFMGRVDLSTYPAAIFLGARGAVWMWRSGLLARLGSAALVLWAGTFGWRYWAGWLA